MHSRNERGFSLVELILALGLLAGVMLAIAGMFSIGGKQVKSGRTSSEALAVGRQILEEMNGWAYRQTYENFGLDGAAASYSVDTRANTSTFAQKWHATLQSKLGASAYATIALSSVVGTGTAPVMNSAVAKNYRVTVTVHWNEITRPRTVTVATVRM
ncbi:MAG TPA: prepilin-type N-terminal cleavage/methylation domain-containing protein [Candidatus Polarisedimenticolaceae bacterium]